MADSILLALVWHMHQPSYRDALSGRVLLPWTRLHATKDYGDMVAVLRRYPRIHATFNLTPVLLDQLEVLGAGGSDLYLELARKPAEALTPDEQRFVARHFFSVHPARLAETNARYRDLKAAAVPSAGARGGREHVFTAQELRDIQTWFHLAWIDPEYANEEPVRALLAKGSGFTEEEKGALLDWGLACAGRVLGLYREAEAAGQIEVSTSAYHHPILPLLISSDAPREVAPGMRLPEPPFRAPEDAVTQLQRARGSHERRLGRAPRGTWPPEGAVDQAAIGMIRAAGFEWCASDETVLARALGRTGPDGDDWPGALARPYAVHTDSGELAMLFRDRDLSDRIGFTYMTWEPERAAEDFIARVRERGSRARASGVGTPVVTVILDGENCWESYPRDGHLFLDALYGRLAADPEVEAVTVSEALVRVPPRDRLARVPVGSWITADLSIWAGHTEKNRAWTELRRVRDRYRAAANDSTLPPERIAEAGEEILIGEGSDWFWWYGDDHQSAHKEEFDALFRSHVIRAYNLLGLSAPAAIRRSLRAASAEGVEEEHVPYIAPRLDGRDTHFYEWRNAELFDTASDQGADHRVVQSLRRLLFGLNESNLFIRIDGALASASANSSDNKRAIRIRFTAPRPIEARIPLGGDSQGALEWSGGDAQDVASPGARVRGSDGPTQTDAGEYAIGSVLEARVPFAALAAGPGSIVRWSVALEDSGQIVESIPRNGELSTPALDPDFEVRNWSAT